MKKTLLSIAAVGAALLLNTNTVQGANLPAGQIDFGQFTPSTEGQFVEINLNSTLLSIASRLTAKADPDTAKLIGGLKSIRVNVIGINEVNRAEINERVGLIRNQLDEQGWQRLVTVKEKKEDVGIFTKFRGEEAVEGIVITVLNGDKQAVLINIVGDIRPEELAAVAERLNIDPLKQVAGAMGNKK